MTEQEWDRCPDPEAMLRFLRASDRESERRGRLFAVACCRAAWDLLTEERSRRAVEVAERFADGSATAQEQEVAAVAAAAAATDPFDPALEEEPSYPALIAWYAAGAAVACHHPPFAAGGGVATARALRVAYDCHGGNPEAQPDPEFLRAYAAERTRQAALLRDFVGNPFRPIFLDPAWLAWHDGAVKGLAQALYDERSLPSGHLDAARLAVLADMLEEAGCSDPQLLGHLRGPGPHVRGCRPVDRLLGKV